jgi:hypothetical protein
MIRIMTATYEKSLSRYWVHRFSACPRLPPPTSRCPNRTAFASLPYCPGSKNCPVEKKLRLAYLNVIIPHIKLSMTGVKRGNDLIHD